MHVTNGIIIQMSNQADQVQSSSTSTNPLRKRKSSIAMEGTLAPYKATERLNPPSYISVERNEHALNEYLSRKMDRLWMLLRHQCCFNNTEQTIPAWTGFYYQVC